jgi:hypothetical protein
LAALRGSAAGSTEAPQASPLPPPLTGCAL